MALRFLNNGYFAGKVGIGVEAPLTNLDILGTSDTYLTIRNTGGGFKSGIRMYGGTAGVSNIWHDDTESNPPGIHFGTSANIATTPTTQLYIKGSDGNVGIGTTSPDAKLEVAGGSTGILLSNLGDSSAYDAVAMTYNGYNSGTPEFIFQPKTNPGSGIVNSYFRFKNRTSVGSNISNVTVDGKIGLGTDSPSSKLSIDAGAQQDAISINSSDGDGPYAVWRRQNGTIGFVGNANALSLSGNTNFGVRATNDLVFAAGGTTERMRINSAGNVGIGTTSPAYGLDVNNSSITSRHGVSSPGASSTGVYNYGVTNSPTWNVSTGSYTNNNTTAPDSSTTAGTYTLTNTSYDLYQTINATSGVEYTVGVWVKLGTATNFCIVINNSQAWNTIGGKSFDASDGLSSSKWTHISFTFTATSTNQVNLHIGAHSETGVPQQTAGTVYLWNLEMATASSTSTWISRIDDEIKLPGDSVWTSRGNVGIGTDSPGATLELNSDTGNAAKLKIGRQNTATNYLELGTSGGSSVINAIGISGVNASLIFNRSTTTTTTQSMIIDGSGNVGIGTTSPGEKLTVHSTATAIQTLYTTNTQGGYTGYQNSTGGVKGFVGYGPTLFTGLDINNFGLRSQSGMPFATGGGNVRMYINSSGNVGIGTTSPTVPLEVSNTSSTSFTYQRTGVSANKWGFHSDNDATYWQNVTSGNLLFTLQNAGNVGINTTQPSEKLDVDGNARVRNLTAGIVTSSATGVLSTGGPTPMNMSLGESYAANIREKYYRTNRTVYPSTIGSQFAQLIQQDLLNSMSLIMSPVATQTSEVSSVRPENNSGDFSFTRATKASRVASSGYIVRQTENYLRYSNEFNNSSYWTLGDATVTWGQADYFGKSTAWKLQDTASTAQHFVRQTTGIGGIVTVSVYAKAGTKSFLYLRGVEGTTSKETFFNLSAGTVGTVEGITASMEAIGSGWYRCSVSFDHNPPYEYYFGVADADNVTSYTGDGTGNIYIANPQIESGIGAREYNATTSSMFYGGETFNVPRIDYKNGVPELLLEKTSTNVVYCSAKMAGLNYITQSFTLSPEGILNGIKINETTASAQHYGHVNCSVVAGTQYFLSFYIKKGTASNVTVYTQSNTIGSNATINLNNGTISASGTDAFIEDVGGGWYRAGYKTPAALQTATSMDIYLPVTSLSSYAGDVNNYTEYYGIQLETAPIVTSHIPTYDGAVTRNNEIIALSNMATNTIASNATAGTLMVEFSNNYTNAGDTLQWHQSPTIIGRGYFYVRQIGFADTWGASGFSTTDGVNTKVIWRLNSLTSGSFFKDGVKSGQTVTGTAWADINKLVIRSDFGTMRIRNIFMSPTALTDDQCIKLTTINE